MSFGEAETRHSYDNVVHILTALLKYKVKADKFIRRKDYFIRL